MKKKSNKSVKHETLRKRHEFNDKTKSHLSISEKEYVFIITITFLLIGLVGINFHEMWRDEYQHWLLAKYSDNLSTLWYNCRYESSGNLLAWHFILFIITRFTSNALFMQLVHILISTSTIYLISKYSPFSRLQKTLISFGYFFVYEYSIIARPYSLTVFVVFLFIIFYRKLPHSVVTLALILALMINIHLYSFVFVFIFSVLTTYKLWSRRKTDLFDRRWKIKAIIASIIFVAGVFFALIQFFRAQTKFVQNNIKWTAGFNFEHLCDTGVKALSAFCPFPTIDRVNIWNQFILGSLPAIFSLVLFILLLVILIIYFSKDKEIAAIFAVGVIVFFIFLYLTNVTGIRYQGHIFILFIAVLWLHKHNTESYPIIGLNSLRKRLNLFTEKLIIVIMLIQILSGALMYYKDIKYPFSNIKKASEFIKMNNLTGYYICGYIDFIVSPLTAMIDKPVFFPQRNEEGNYILWDDKRSLGLSGQVLFSRLYQKVLEKDSILFIYSNAVIDKNGVILNNFIYNNKDGRMEGTLLGACDDENMVGDERFYFYLLKKVISPIPDATLNR